MAADSATEGSARIEVLIVDMNGRLRGKQIPMEAEKKVWSGAVRLPTSTQSLDIWGDDNDHLTGLSLTIGDPDGTCVADPRGHALGAAGVEAGSGHHARARRQSEFPGSARYSFSRRRVL